MPKTEVYSWRVSAAVKSRLEDAARRERRTVAAVLDELVRLHLALKEQSESEDDVRQRELHTAAARFAGRLAGRDPERATDARGQIRNRLRSRHGART